MVTRKPVAPQVNTQQPAAANPPYPTTPILGSGGTNTSSVYSPNLATSPAFDLIDMDQARQRPRSDSDASHNTWDSGGSDEDTPEDDDIPKPLKITPSKQNLKDEQASNDLPAALRPGPIDGVRKSQESQRSELEDTTNPWAIKEQKTGAPQAGTTVQSHNPFLKAQPTGQSAFGNESSNAVWGDVPHTQPQPPPPMSAPPPPPVELPTVRSPVEEPGRMSLHTLSDEVRQMSMHDPSRPSGSFDTVETLPVPQQSLQPIAEQHSGGTNPWQGQQPTPEDKWGDADDSFPPPPPKSPRRSISRERQQEERYAPPPGPPPSQTPSQTQPTPHSLLDEPTGPLELEQAPDKPPRPIPGPISTAHPSAARSSESVPETPLTRAKRQRNEHYQIKHINWYDASYSLDPRMTSPMRTSPILTQNANGPCPLLALVNALVLSTPQNIETALVETLRTREQVSLGLLLDAVFDELMSGRRGETAHELPDVSDLYSFLLALHTGMNVNPRFVSPAITPRGSLDGHPPELHGIHPLERAQSKPGCFEETREMRLYSTFNVPLIHGWTCPKDSPAYAVFARSAKTFEDAQNIQFAEAELEEKLHSDGLSGEEQQTLQDIQTIKQFLSTWPTQLTDYGLESISKTLRPGQIAILFRNDHFSTLYKEPKSDALMTLVTDAGYSTHDEIVWESLVDVNGAASELFSGDFRPVSHNQDARVHDSPGSSDGWQTVDSRSRYKGRNVGPLQVTNGAATPDDTPPPLPGPRPTSRQATTPTPLREGENAEDTGAPAEAARKAAEQEDHDLALALQLQEEEEDQHRQAEAQRRRETELNEQFLAREHSNSNTTASEGRPPAIPPRRNMRGGRAQTSRPADAEDPDAPPSYEQAASDRPYRPSGSTAPPAQGNPLSAYDHLRRQQSAYAQQSSATVNTVGSQGHGRRRSDQGNRIRRRSSVMAQGQMPQVATGYPGRVQQGPRPQAGQDDERCTIM